MMDRVAQSAVHAATVRRHDRVRGNAGGVRS
jgi:hypothetical protein